jgi:hypothetical protein
MLENNEYEKVLEILYNKSLILENFSDFHPQLGFWFFEALAHLDISISQLAYNADSPRNILSRELLKFKADIIQKEPYSRFKDFMIWLKKENLQEYEKNPLFLQKIYDCDDKASYRSFRIILNPDDKKPIPPEIFRVMIDEMFDKAYLASLYNGSTMALLYKQFMDSI